MRGFIISWKTFMQVEIPGSHFQLLGKQWWWCSAPEREQIMLKLGVKMNEGKSKSQRVYTMSLGESKGFSPPVRADSLLAEGDAAW